MADVYLHDLHLKPLAHEAYTQRKAQIMAWRRIGLINSDQARDLLAQNRQEFSRVEYLDFDPSRNVGVRCEGCAKLHIMPADISHFTCECSPHVGRSAHLARESLDAKTFEPNTIGAPSHGGDTFTTASLAE